MLERLDELGTTVRIATVVNGVYPDEDIAAFKNLCPRQSVGEKNRVPRRHISYGNSLTHLFGMAPLWNIYIACQRGSTEGSQIDLHDSVLIHTDRPCDSTSRLKFHFMPL